MKNNVIKRTSNKMWVEWKIDTSHTKKGDISLCKKTDRGWVDFVRNLFIPIATLRNSNICIIKEQFVGIDWENI